MPQDNRMPAPRVGVNTGMVAIEFPGREQYVMRNQTTVLALILELNEAYKTAWPDNA